MKPSQPLSKKDCPDYPFLQAYLKTSFLMWESDFPGISLT